MIEANKKPHGTTSSVPWGPSRDSGEFMARNPDRREVTCRTQGQERHSSVHPANLLGQHTGLELADCPDSESGQKTETLRSVSRTWFVLSGAAPRTGGSQRVRFLSASAAQCSMLCHSEWRIARGKRNPLQKLRTWKVANASLGGLDAKEPLADVARVGNSGLRCLTHR